jgi:hypothetical protein
LSYNLLGKMKVAIEGCCHNQLDEIYKTLKHIENVEKIKIDLLLICGDFQVGLFPKSIFFVLNINLDKLLDHTQYRRL